MHQVTNDAPREKVRGNQMLAHIRRARRGSRASSWITAGVSTAVLAAVALGAAVAGGVFAAAPAYAVAQAHPVSSTMIKAITSGSSTRIVRVPDAVQRGGTTIGQNTAESAALAWLRRPGTRVLGASLAYLSTPNFGPHRLVWLVSLDPAGGIQSVASPVGSPVVTENYCMAIVSAATGQWLMTAAGKSGSLPALPKIPASNATR
jgi:hypothetical protein